MDRCGKLKTAVYKTSSASGSATLYVYHGHNRFQDREWMTGAGEHFVAMADFDFTAGSDSEISFEAGDEIRNVAHFRLKPFSGTS